jgi:hypothetical protein
MKYFLVLILSGSLSGGLFAQQDSVLSQNDNKINWQDVVVLVNNSFLDKMLGMKGEFFLHRRKNVHSMSNLNESEIKEIKKNAASCGATIAYISFTMSDNDNIYYLCVLSEKGKIKTK